MLTPSSPQTLPSLSTCNAGRLVAGTTAAQIAIGALNCASVKMLGEAHYHLQRKTVGFPASLFQINQIIEKGHEETWQLLYATTPLSEWVWFGIDYSASTAQDDTPTLHVSLKSVVSGAIDGTIDAGCVLDYYLETVDEPQSNPTRISSGWSLTRAPSGGTSNVPRPLYVPEAYRGQVICVRLAAVSVAVTALHLIDIYQEA